MSNELESLKRERASLLAHCELLKEALVFCDREHDGYYINNEIVNKSLNNPPNNSLADIQAKAIESAIERTAEEFEMGFVCPIFSLKYLAKKVRSGEVKI